MHWALKSKKEPMLKSAKDTDEFQADHSETQVPKEGITSNELSSGNFFVLFCFLQITAKSSVS